MVRGTIGGDTEDGHNATAREVLGVMLECGAIGMGLVDTTGRFLECNDCLLDMLGYSRADMAAGGLSVADITPQEFSPRDAAARQQLLSHGSVAPFSKEFVRKDGSRVPVLASGVALGGQGEEAPWACLATDTDWYVSRYDMARQCLELARTLVRKSLELADGRLPEEAVERRSAERELRLLTRRLVRSQEEERRAIAREIHDETGQSLSVLSMLLARMSGSVTPGGRVYLEQAQQTVKDILAQIRNLSLRLRPGMIDDVGLLAAVLWYLDSFSARTGIKVDLEHSGLKTTIHPEVSLTAYRIIQEGLTNVMRHAGVPEASVKAAVDDRGCLVVSIRDGGKGFDAAALPAACSGVRTMRERALAIGGEFRIESAAGQGTRVIAELPLNPALDA